ncbi:hypothetical protein F4859DRAFT_529560 [Xylaria cf. heliscus]|nr:hypothetical protein F4859DRAFT_529560 [Xylaria cf. heliscus]
MGNCIIVLAFLTLVTLADNIVTNALPVVLGSVPPQEPGFWNFTTTALILCTVSDLIGQLILIPVACHYGSRYAMNLNSLSVLIASTISLASLFWRAGGVAWIPTIAGIFKILGGGPHATLFLAITIIRKNASGSLRSGLIYTTGAAVVLCQTIASAVTPFLAAQSPTLPYIFSIVCCVLACAITIVYNATRSPESDRACANDPSTQPLLPHQAANRDPNPMTPWGLGEVHYRIWKSKPSMARKALKSLGVIFFLAAVAKATRPLFITYIQHRAGVTPEFASCLWFIRTVMSLVIFIVALPLIVTFLAKYTPSPPIIVNLYAAKIGIILLAAGALLIGLARPKPVLVSGLVINTLGVATDLALLAFAADVVTDDLANCFFMTIASLESTGTLFGIGLLYPLYQLCLHDDTLLGGIPYYVCAGLFTIAAVRVWRIKALAI